MLIYLIIGLVFAIYELCEVIYEGRKRVIDKIREIRDTFHKYGWNISFKRCYVISMILALTMVCLTWPYGIILRIIHKRKGILDFINK